MSTTSSHKFTPSWNSHLHDVRSQSQVLGSRSSFWLTVHHPNFKAALKTVWRDTVHIARSICSQWWPLLVNLFALCIIAGLICLNMALPATRPLSYDLSYCVPGGDFSLYQEYNPYRLDHVFQITIGFGTLSFTEAKTLDVAWDIVVGRGGQAILAFFTFRIFTKCLTRLLERSGAIATYDLFDAIVFQQNSLSSIWKLCVGVTKRKKARDIFALLWMILAASYVVAFQSWISAMTGYTSVVSPFITTLTGSQIPWRTNRAFYVVHDGDRLNKTKDFIVGGDNLGYSDGFEPYYECLLDISYPWSSDTPQACAFAANVSRYVFTYGSQTVENKSSLFNGTIELPPPTLNITTFNVSDPRDPYWEEDFGLFSLGNSSQHFDPLTIPIMYNLNGELYNATYVQANTQCINKADYQWGFSFLSLFAFSIVSTVWVIGMYATYQDAFWNSRLDRIPRRMGLLRGVTDVANAMKSDGLDPKPLASNTAIKKELNGRKGEITYSSLDMRELVSRKTALHEWARNIPSFRGWTYPWTMLQWIWLFIWFVLGTPWCNYFIKVMLMPLSWWFCCILLFIGLWGNAWRLGQRFRRRHRAGRVKSWPPPKYDTIDDRIEMSPAPPTYVSQDERSRQSTPESDSEAKHDDGGHEHQHREASPAGWEDQSVS